MRSRNRSLLAALLACVGLLSATPELLAQPQVQRPDTVGLEARPVHDASSWATVMGPLGAQWQAWKAAEAAEGRIWNDNGHMTSVEGARVIGGSRAKRVPPGAVQFIVKAANDAGVLAAAGATAVAEKTAQEGARALAAQQAAREAAGAGEADDPRGEGPGGDDPEGDDPEGDDPEGDDPEGDDPEGDDPEGDDPEGDDPEGDDPEGDDPEGDDPEGDDPEGDDPEGDDPEGDDPEGDDPEGDDPGDGTGEFPVDPDDPEQDPGEDPPPSDEGEDVPDLGEPPPDPEPPAEALLDLEYGTQHPRQVLDLYLPPEAADGPVPVLLFFHGGAFVAGDKSQGEAFLPIVDAGYALASANYLLLNRSSFDQVDFQEDVGEIAKAAYDARAAVRYLKDNAADLGIDGSRIAVAGASAGGYLAAAVGACGDEGQIRDEQPTSSTSAAVKGVLDISGPTDFATFSEHKSGESLGVDIGLVRQFLNGAGAVNPFEFASGGDPPHMIRHGQLDDVVPVEQSTTYTDALEAAGVDVDLRVYPTQGHSIEGADREDILGELTDFLDRVLN